MRNLALLFFVLEVTVMRYFRLLMTLLTIWCSATMFAQSPRTLTPDTVVLNLDVAPGEAPLHVTLAQMMSIYKDPGFSIAVVDQDHIACATGFGVTSADGGAPVTPHTLFQAASISKPVVAAGALWLVEHAKLPLDKDVNLKLKSWKVPDNQFTVKQKVTMRRILCHSAGFNVHGLDGYAPGQPLPTMVQTLDGVPPANNPPVRVKATPGTGFDYSGGGFTVAGLLIHDVSGQPLEGFLRTHVLLPAGMKESTFQQPLPPALAALAASGTDAGGKTLPGKWRVYPELAPDGLWTTPSDLAKFAIEIALSADGKANHILSQDSVRKMLTIQAHDEPTNDGGVGLGFALGYQHQPAIFFHMGSNAGFQSLLMMDPVTGWGYAAMGNSDNFGPINGAVLNTLSDWYGWKVASKTGDLGQNLTVVHALRDTQAALTYYQNAKLRGFADLHHDANSLNNFGYMLLGEKNFQDAIRVFQFNVAEYPGDWNAYDSLGEAYMDAGERDLAIANYEKSVKLNPKNENGVAKLKELRAK